MYTWHTLYFQKGFRPDRLEFIRHLCQEVDPKIELYAPCYTYYKKNRLTTKYIYPGYLFIYCNKDHGIDKMLKAHKFFVEFLLNETSTDLAEITTQGMDLIKQQEELYKQHKVIDKKDVVKPGQLIIIKLGPYCGRKAVVKYIKDSLIYVTVKIKKITLDVPLTELEIDLPCEADDNEIQISEEF